MNHSRTHTTSESLSPDDRSQFDRVVKAIGSRSFGVLSTVSAAGFPHAAGVAYTVDGLDLWIHTMRSSRKARNVVDHDRIGMVIPVRRLPVGPPFTVQFQGRAELVGMDDAVAVDARERGALKAITSHGELDESDGVFVRIRPTGSLHSYGIGVRMLDIIRDPLHAGARSVTLP